MIGGQMTGRDDVWRGTDEQIVADAERRYAGLMLRYPDRNPGLSGEPSVEDENEDAE